MTRTPQNAIPSTVPVERFAVRALVALALTIATGTCFALLVVAVRVNWTPLHAVDRAVADRLNRAVSENEVLLNVLHGATSLGGTATLLWLTGIGVVWLLVRHQPWVAAYVAVTALGAMVLGVVVKELVGRLRPVVDLPVSSAPGPGFPSGHALGSLVSYGVLVLVFLPVVRRSRRWMLLTAAALLVVLIGTTRIALGAHYPTDVLGGWLLGALWLALTAAAFQRWRTEAGVRKTPLSEGLVPEAAPDLDPAPRTEVPLPRPWRAAAELLVGWGLLAGGLFGLGQLVMGPQGERPAVAWDVVLVDWLGDRRSPALDSLMVPLGHLGSTSLVIASALVVGPLFLAITRSWTPVLFLALTLAGEISLFLVTTAVTRRSRPDVPATHPDLPPTSSFPSGHVAAATALYLATAVLVFTATARRWRWLFVVAAVVVPALVAAQRLYTAAHYPTDVLGGVLLAVAWTALVSWVVQPHRVLPAASRSAEPDAPP